MPNLNELSAAINKVICTYKPVVLTKPYVQILLIDILDRKYL